MWPDTDKASTANAIRDDFTDEDTKTWTEAFFGDAKVWKTEEYVATKSDYMDWINQENENWEQEKENLASDENNRAYIENYEKEHQDRINEMTAQMETHRRRRRNRNTKRRSISWCRVKTIRLLQRTAIITGSILPVRWAIWRLI